MVCMSAPVFVMSPLLSHTDRKPTRDGHLSKMIPITWCFFHYMVPLPDAVKADEGKRGSEKTDYRNQLLNYSGVDVWFIEIYFTGAVRNENINCKGVGSFPEAVCFEVFPVRALWRDLVGFLIADLLNTVDSLPVKGGCL